MPLLSASDMFKQAWLFVVIYSKNAKFYIFFSL